ncbi:MAG: glycosyltransferase [Candidatus Nanoarchaeia archaeon]
MISVIIPTLNEEQYLPNLLKDLKNQKLEVIVVDGNSKDNTVKIAKKFKAKIIITKKRNGSYQRNLGAKKAKGDQLLFIDADMRIPKGTIKKLKSTNAIAALPFITLKQKTWPYRICVEPANLFARLFPGMFARGGCILVNKKAFLKAGGFNPKMAVAEDIDLGQRLRKLGKIKMAPCKVFESDRRYRKYGYLKVLLDWWLNAFWCTLFGKSFYTHWNPVR